MVTVLRRNVLVPIINTSRWGIIGSNNYLIIHLSIDIIIFKEMKVIKSVKRSHRLQKTSSMQSKRHDLHPK